ncbi:MAG TPA: pantoate--beta-alanine ligase [Armatimonadota bacterium]|nr:pantoate--beta-alanine ligase [Armatimonadota bacterium]
METLTTVAELRDAIRTRRSYLKRVGFVPTMGYLHAGHEALIRRAHEECDLVVVSIFVNPTQFGPNEDLEKYPRDLAHDQEVCERAGADLIFHPDPKELYPRGNNTWVSVEGLTEIACGAARPGHFRGVTTVCAKLFNIVRPDRAYFGEKDYQQLQVIRRMVRDLFMPLTIVGVPTVREQDGVALSSRNSYLSPTERQAARIVPRLWQMAQQLVEHGELESEKIVEALQNAVAAQPLAKLEYALILDPETLTPMRVLTHEARLLLAVHLGKTRLIDNAPLVPKAPRPGTVK